MIYKMRRVAILLLILFASIPQAYAISEADVETAIAASSQEAVAGNLLVWFLCAVGFLKISQNIDSFLSSLGLNVGRTGGSMLTEAIIAGRALGSSFRLGGTARGSANRAGRPAHPLPPGLREAADPGRHRPSGAPRPASCEGGLRRVQCLHLRRRLPGGHRGKAPDRAYRHRLR